MSRLLLVLYLMVAAGGAVADHWGHPAKRAELNVMTGLFWPFGLGIAVVGAAQKIVAENP